MIRPLIIAHRGASAIAVENSPAALEAAIVHHADFAEFDIRPSRDGVPICCHDADLARLKARRDTVASLDSGELAALGFLSLAQLLELARGRIPLLLDCKAETEAFFASVAESLVEAGAADDAIVLGVRSLEAARAARTFLPGLAQLGLLATETEIAPFVESGGAFIRLWENDADEAIMARLRDSFHRPIWITLGTQGRGNAGETEPIGLARVLALEPDAILINDPRLINLVGSVSGRGRQLS
jgi:glycerophosphoryl diester phosphodiesterase